MPVTFKVKDAMDTNLVTIDWGAPVDEAVKKMIQGRVWSQLVVKDGKPEGAVTERDVIRRCVAKGLDTSGTSVGSIASSPLITIGPDATMREAMDIMAAKGIRRLFVVENGRVVGRITQTEAFHSILSVMEIFSSLNSPL